MDFIERDIAGVFRDRLKQFQVVALTGPRQSGKTTLVRQLLPDWRYVNLEDMDARGYAQEDPRGFLQEYGPGTILDEFQRVPEITSYLQGVVDEHGGAGQYVLTGSQSYMLHAQLSQSLAGRVGLLTLLPFSLREVRRRTKDQELERLLWGGGFPPVVARDLPPDVWLSSYLSVYVERDVRQLVALKDLLAFQRFLKLLASRVGQLVNYSSLAADCGISQPTAKNWLSVLEAGYVVQRLAPWYSSQRKRLVKSPKLFFYDTGLLCRLLEVDSPATLRSHQMLGGIFENWVLLEIQKTFWNLGRSRRVHFWRDLRGREIDFVIPYDGGLIPVEAKAGRTVQPSFFKSLASWPEKDQSTRASAVDGKSRPSGFIVYGGDQSQSRHGVAVLPWTRVADICAVAEGDPSSS